MRFQSKTNTRELGEVHFIGYEYKRQKRKRIQEYEAKSNEHEHEHEAISNENEPPVRGESERSRFLLSI